MHSTQSEGACLGPESRFPGESVVSWAQFYKAIKTLDANKLSMTSSYPYRWRQNKFTIFLCHKQAGWPVRGTTLASELLIFMTEFPWIYSHILKELLAHTYIRLKALIGTAPGKEGGHVFSLTPHTFQTGIKSHYKCFKGARKEYSCEFCETLSKCFCRVAASIKRRMNYTCRPERGAKSRKEANDI